MYDRQSVVQTLVESALRAAADPEITSVLRTWDSYDEDTSSQPLMPFLVVGVSDDIPLGIGWGLYRATLTVTLVVNWAPAIRDQFDRIRASVRSAVEALRGVMANCVLISGTREISCTEPEIISPQGDVVTSQILTYTVWFESPTPEPAVIDPEIYLAAYDEATHTTYTTCQAQDPRRIARWVGPLSSLQVSYAFGSWAERASLEYSAPVPPLSTQIPPVLPINPSAGAS